MKAELIADWRLRIADRTLITLRVTDIERILEERERLLVALKYLYASEDEQWKNPNLDPKAAITFAESE